MGLSIYVTASGFSASNFHYIRVIKYFIEGKSSTAN